MQINLVGVAFGGMCLTGVAFVAYPIISAMSAEPVAAEQTAEPTPVPTTTITPNATTTQTALADAVAAYTAAIASSGGVEESIFTANGYASTAAMNSAGDISITTNAPTIPQIVRTSKGTYVQLGGEELTSSAPLRAKVGKPAATWTTNTAALTPTLNLWLTPVNLASSVAGLTPGLQLKSLVRQTDGTITITSDIYPERITDTTIRDAFRLPIKKKPTEAGKYRADFGIDTTGRLTRLVVTTEGSPVQIVVKEFKAATVTAPTNADTITQNDIKKATKKKKRD